MGLKSIAEILDINEKNRFLEQENRIKAAKPHPVDVEYIEQELLQEAEHLYIDLCKSSIV